MRKRLDWIEILVLLSVLCLLIAIVYPGVKSAREAAARSICKERLSQIGVALHAYHDEHGCFPPSHFRGPDGKRWHSWRVMILPQLGYPELYKAYDFSQPWDAPDNQSVIAQIPEELADPRFDAGKDVKTNFVALVGKRTMWPAHQSLTKTDVRDGTSNTLHVVECQQSVVWTSPDDSNFAAFQADLQDSREHGRATLLVDGSVQHLMSSLDQSILASLATPSFGREVYLGDWPPDLETDTSTSKRVQINVDTYGAVDITPHFDASITESKTTLWCATSQMSWDLLRDAIKVDGIRLKSNVPSATALNADRFSGEALSEQSYVITISGIGSGQDQLVAGQIKTAFSNADPEVSDLSGVADLGVRTFCYLEKRMPFADELQALKFPLEFGLEKKHTVGCFGFEPEPGRHDETVFDKVVDIVDYVSDDDFILQLTTASQQVDEIILAKIPASETLKSAWRDVEQRIQSPHRWHDRPKLMREDRLHIPVFDFHLVKHFSELEGQEVLNGPFTGQNELELFKRVIRFRLDHSGSDLIAYSELALIGELGENETDAPQSQPRNFLFNKPFLIALREQDAARPYFVGWIGNASLMEAFE